MKRFAALLLALLLLLGLAACNEQAHVGQAKTPSGSSIQKGRDYQQVYDDFQAHGFTNIHLAALDDLILGWLTKDGEVESVSVDGDSDYSADTWYPADTEVIITYHTFPAQQTDTDEPTPSPSPTPKPTEKPTPKPEPTPTPESAPTPEPTPTPEPMVWIPQSGARYHRSSSCSGMKDPSQVPLSTAIAWGYTPCGKCY